MHMATFPHPHSIEAPTHLDLPVQEKGVLLRKLEAAEAAVRGMQGTLLSMADGAKAAAVAAGGGVPVVPGGAPAAAPGSVHVERRAAASFLGEPSSELRPRPAAAPRVHSIDSPTPTIEVNLATAADAPSGARSPPGITAAPPVAAVAVAPAASPGDSRPVAGFTQEGLPVITARGDGTSFDVRIGPDYRRNGKKAASLADTCAATHSDPVARPDPGLIFLPLICLPAGTSLSPSTASKGRRFRTTSPRACGCRLRQRA